MRRTEVWCLRAAGGQLPCTHCHVPLSLRADVCTRRFPNPCFFVALTGRDASPIDSPTHHPTGLMGSGAAATSERCALGATGGAC
jgi:hypothetical protein